MIKVKVPPIKSQGIKTKLVPTIVDLIKWDFSGIWIEPFVGSGVVGFNVRPQRAIFCDTNPHIINFYNSIKNGELTSIKARKFLESEGKKLSLHGADYYYEVRERFNALGKPLDFLFLNRSCFNGMIRFNGNGEFNVPFGHKPNRFAPAYITKIVNQIAYVEDALKFFDWEFVTQGFEKSLISSQPNDFIYCDPPYIARHSDYFNSWDEIKENKLHKLLSKVDAKFILSTWHSNEYRVNPFIENLTINYFVVTIEHFYHIGAKEKNRKPMLEALVMNYAPEISYELEIEEQLKLFDKGNRYQT